MIFDRTKPYNDLPNLPPNREVETRAILRKTITAGRALAELKGVGNTIPNQRMLIDSLTLQEAKASSEIENIITTSDKLYQAFATNTSKVDAATKEVLRYREALWQGYEELQNLPVLRTNLFIQIVQTLRGIQSSIRNTPGTHIKNDATGEIVYTPPEGEGIIRDKLANLERFLHEENGLDPLIRMAIAHYQFEAIHPFTDGNGRTGRIINILFLVMQDLLDLPVLYLSKAIIENKSDYYRLLREVTENNDWEPWILYMLDAVEQTANFTRNRVLAIRKLMEETMAIARDTLPSHMPTKDLVELLFHQPYTKVQFIVDAQLAKRQTAATYLKEMEKIGIIRSFKSGKETLYMNTKLYQLLAN